MPTALLSVYDKSGITDLAAGLHAAGWRILSSGGTAGAVAATGVPVTDVAELTGLPAILGHRVVTLHPNVHGGILADRDDPTHRADLEQYGIEPIDLVVVNLYPFGSNPGIELIDIGGPAMVRAAAKNHAHVAVVVDPADYATVLAEVAADGAISRATRRALARTAFATTAAYDAAITAWLSEDTAAADWPTATGTATATDCRRGSTSGSPGSRSCATARTPTRPGPATAWTGRRAGSTPPCSTAVRSSATSTSTTPRPRGGSSTASTSPPA